MSGKLSAGKRVLLAVLLLGAVLGAFPAGLGQGQTTAEPTPPGQPDPAITDLSFELFTQTVVLVTINISNLGTEALSSGRGQLFLQTPGDSEAIPIGAFFFGAVGPGASTRAGAQFSISQKPDGPYTITAELSPTFNELDLENNRLVETLTLLREPQLRPVQIDFSPPFFDPTLVDQVQVQALVDNFGLQPSLNDSQVTVEFAFCRVQPGDQGCNSDSFAVFATQGLDLSSVDLFPSGKFVLNPFSEIRTREWQLSACLPLNAAGATADCPGLGGALEPGVYIVRVRVDPENVLPETDENDNVEFARFTIPGAGGGLPITNFVVGINGEEARGMLFYTPDESTLIGVDKRELERMATCVGIVLQPRCPYDANPQLLALLKQFSTATPNPNSPGQGTVKIDVFSSAFRTFDSQFQQGQVGKPTLLEEDLRPARITKMVQNRSRQVLYVGLSDGRLIRYNFSNPSAIKKNVFSLQGGEIAALQVIDNGVYIGANNPNSNEVEAQGKVFFLQDNQEQFVIRDQFIPLGNRIQQIAVSPSATTVFVTTVQDNQPSQPKLRLWWAANQVENGRLTGFIDSLQQVSLGSSFSGEAWNDFAINARQRSFLSVTDSAGNSQLYGYIFRKITNNGQQVIRVSSLFGPLSALTDQCDGRQVELGAVKALALGDDSPQVTGDQVLYVATAQTPRLLTLQIQRRNSFTSIIEDVTNPSELLKWWVQLEGDPTSIKVDDAGQGRGRNPDGSTVFPNGKVFVPVLSHAVNVVDGLGQGNTGRGACDPKVLSLTLPTGFGIVAPMDTGPSTGLDPLTFELVTSVVGFYGADGIYIWTARVSDI